MRERQSQFVCAAATAGEWVFSFFSSSFPHHSRCSYVRIGGRALSHGQGGDSVLDDGRLRKD